MRRAIIPREDILTLTADISRHNAPEAVLAFASALLAEYGFHSAIGRVIDRFTTMNTTMLLALENLPAVRELSLRRA